MLDDPVTKAALTVFVIVFIAIVIALTVLYLIVRSGEKGPPKPPHKGQMLLAGIIGVAIPLLILAYAVVFSPSARLTPEQLHKLEMQKAPDVSKERK
jgi:drug/metabolite transporter (DMT)-like permease